MTVYNIMTDFIFYEFFLLFYQTIDNRDFFAENEFDF